MSKDDRGDRERGPQTIKPWQEAGSFPVWSPIRDLTTVSQPSRHGTITETPKSDVASWAPYFSLLPKRGHVDIVLPTERGGWTGHGY